MKAIHARWLFPLVYGLVLCTGAEWGSRYWIRHHGDALDITRQILEMDVRLGWRQRTGLQTAFLGKSIQTNEIGFRSDSVGQWDPALRQVLVLGPSSTFGWGVRGEETYASRLQNHLLSKGLPVQVINGGEIGYSTEQGLRLWDTLDWSRLRPQWVILAYGINDIDRTRFYFQSDLPDAEELSRAHNEAGIRCFQALFASSAFAVLYKAAAAIRSAAVPIPSYDAAPPLRVGLAAFETNIRALVERARSLEARAVLVTTPADFRAALEPDENENWYHRSAAYARLGQMDLARQALESARASEPGRLRRDIALYNNRVRALASADSIPLVDADLLAHHTGKTWFVDPVHPSALGHSQIAEALARIITNQEMAQHVSR